jgi:uncharacterized caspase-like protein
MLVLGLCPASAQKKIYIVATGIADYPGTSMDLSLCANDAATIKWVFEKNKKASTVLLTNSQVTKSAVLKALRQQFSKATKDDAILFFYSGHGAPGKLVFYDGQIDYQDIKDIMAKSKARSKMIFADACFSGKMRNEQRTQHNTSVPANLRNTEVMFFLSSRSDETSIERRDMKNGFFTAYLQRGLRGGADANRDRTITALELFNFVSKGVRKISNDKQHPVMWGKFDNNMPVISW